MSSKRNAQRALPPKNILSEDEIFKQISEFLLSTNTPIITIVGPTASGKTDFSIRLAKYFGGEVINADSRQFYRGMDIGTAKITSKEMKGVPHHLLDFLNPDEECSVAVFKKIAEKEAKEILSRKKIPFLVGGSGLFGDAIRKNFDIPRVPPQKKWREKQADIPLEMLYEKLEKIDTKAAQNINPKNRNRIIRALEVFEITGKKISELQKQKKPMFDVLLIGVWRDPEELEQRIEKRTEMLWNSGFLEEVKKLIDLGFTEKTPAMIAHGYREAMQYLSGTLSQEEAKYLMTRNTRRYAKRQRTWWRREENMLWVQV